MPIRKPGPKSPLDDVINEAISELKSYEVGTEEYSKALDNLGRLYEMRKTDKVNTISKDAVLSVAGNLLGIVFILQHEKAHVVTSKALSFVSKLK